jgi:hypothetical protein
VPWSHDGCNGLALRARADVPSYDEAMVRGALVRGAASCDRVGDLDRAINRQLWPLGYVARLERSAVDEAVITVEISTGR